jgi:hypothetical protein
MGKLGKKEKKKRFFLHSSFIIKVLNGGDSTVNLGKEEKIFSSFNIYHKNAE